LQSVAAWARLSSHEAATYFQETLQRTPNRPKAIFGLALAAQAAGDNGTARRHYEEFLKVWKALASWIPL